ncbi:hypothetical protein DL89DRAFT_248762 [Linderina pennispora]|uniref:Phosphotransferase n=1 Tax=Linderina pennispora TaxID=61395 RepID=A0A1Y1W0N5_9FUNG|nr:uncharacterized protein DL89DRAFT_248762 [Linderina pennispora]ORX67067.1 hypothetical protein DL89DRAFT_248762 [Linderina pennispora]
MTAVDYKIAGATPEQQEAVDMLVKQFLLTDSRLGEIIKEFRRRMEDGLAHDGRVVRMFPSYVTRRPTGSEAGSYYAIDLGGTNLRVLKVTLDGAGGVTTEHQKFSLTEEAKTKTLFDFIAQSIETFLDDRNLRPTGQDEPISMGFTFSYPVQQTSINSGILSQWTKGLNVPGCVGRDVVRLLQDALLRLGLRVKISALVNDTVGTLLSAAYKNPAAQMGIIFGTGTNAAYYENIDNIGKWNGPRPESGEMVVNMEWGAFDSNDFAFLPFTQHDIKLDRKSINPRKQAYEKMISGMYLGEIARNVILWLADQRLMFGGCSSEVLNAMWSIDTSYLSNALEDTSEDLDEIKCIIEKTLSIAETTLVDRKIFRLIAALVGERAARLSAIGVVATLGKRPELLKKAVHIGIDGSMYEFWPNFDKMLSDTVSHFLAPEQFANVSFGLAKDGSGVGAAIIAMLASQE